MKKAATSIWLAMLSVAVGTAQQPAQPPATPTFRATTRLIIETVNVKDKNGNPVEGLTTKDFIVTEDGEPQTVSVVEFQRLTTTPVANPSSIAAANPGQESTPTPRSALSKVASATNVQISSGKPGDVQYRNRRLLVLYFDLTAMPPPDLLRAYNAARTFIDTQMTPAELVAVMAFQGGGVRVKQDFTDDKPQLLDVIQTLVFGEDKDGQGLPDTLEEGTAFGQDDAEFAILNTDRQLSALQTAVGMLRPLPDQKALIYFASGLRLNGVDNQAQLHATTNAALRSNVLIFPVDARGLVAMAPLGDATRQSPGGLTMFTGQQAGTVQTTFQRSQDTLYALGKDTGGKALFDYNDLSLGIVQAAQAVTSYYIVGFYSNHSALDGKFHRVKISLASPLSADLSYRQGYYADKEFAKFSEADKERQLEDALMLDNPITDITIAMEVNYFQLNRAEYFVPVAVKIPGRELALARRRGATHTLLDFIGEVKDDHGITMQNVREKVDIKLSDDAAAQLAKRPIQYQTGFTLLPGNYVIKFLARDADTGRIGTFQTSFVIPNLNREEKRIPISSVVLSSQRVSYKNAILNLQKGNTAQAADPLVFEGEQLIPNVTRVFSKSRDLYVFLQAYERGATTEPLVAFVTFYRGAAKAFETSPLSVTEGGEG
ncbi:MAG TPA: VWA domain-containing protein, partial [Vicinamibacterales bacterium]|nr:VWA domain-containing protein [Vicinamibacterales bacterium]